MEHPGHGAVASAHQEAPEGWRPGESKCDHGGLGENSITRKTPDPGAAQVDENLPKKGAYEVAGGVETLGSILHANQD